MDGGNKTIINIEEALKQNNYDAIRSVIQERTSVLISLFHDSSFELLEKEIEREKAQLSFWVKKELVERSVHFLFGRYIGIIDAIDQQLAAEYTQKSLINSINSYDISEIPHINDIIATVWQDEGIRHGKLAEKVGIEKSTLTGIMDKLVEKKVVCFSRPGKYKYYYLTDFGKKYYNDNRINIEAETNIDALTEQLLLALSKDDNANNTIIHIIKVLCEGHNNFKGFNAKTTGKVDPAYIFAGIPTIKQINVMFPDVPMHTVNNAEVYSINPNGAVQEKFVMLSSNNDNHFIRHPKFSITSIINA